MQKGKLDTETDKNSVWRWSQGAPEIDSNWQNLQKKSQTQKEEIWPTPSSWVQSFSNGGTVYFSSLSHPVCGAALWQPWDTNGHFFLCLASFTEHNVFIVHPYWNMNQHCIFCGWEIFHYVDILHSFTTYQLASFRGVHKLEFLWDKCYHAHPCKSFYMDMFTELQDLTKIAN